MYLLPNPVAFPIKAELLPNAQLRFLDSTITVLCAHSEFGRALVFELVEATRMGDCADVEKRFWRLRDAGQVGNARKLEITFQGKEFMGSLEKFEQLDPKAQQRLAALYDALVGNDELSLLIRIADSDDPTRVDSLLITTSYGSFPILADPCEEQPSRAAT